jgi:hypothetical protein
MVIGDSSVARMLALESEFMNNQLRAELLERIKKEQKLRRELIDKPDDVQLMMHMIEADAQNTMWLDEVTKQYGWPGKSLVGEDGTQAAFLIVQHSPAVQFQKKCLALLEAAVSQNEADITSLAYLTDRVRLSNGKPQVYGTQGQHEPDGVIVPLPIENEEHVDERRKAIGLEPIAEYFKSMNESYKTRLK